jgi:glycosyltransferase involved in cell wall biosynthesis
MNNQPNKKERKVIVVLPAYNAESTLRRTINDIPLGSIDEIILVDDNSKDATVDTAKKLAISDSRFVLVSENDYAVRENKIPIIVYKHDKNKGYGGNQKTCYTLALKRGATIVIMLHPDYQYDPRLIKYFVEFIQDGYFDIMLGSRIRTRKEALAGGMPHYKYVANRALTLMENLVSGQNLTEWHTGMRAYTKEVLEKTDFLSNSDDFVFDTQMLFKMIEGGFKIGEVPVPVRYFPEASSINFKRSVRYGLHTVWESLKHLGRKISKSP